MPSGTRSRDRLNLKGRVGEALVENIFRRAGYKVARLGRESQVQQMLRTGIGFSGLEDDRSEGQKRLLAEPRAQGRGQVPTQRTRVPREIRSGLPLRCGGAVARSPCGDRDRPPGAVAVLLSGSRSPRIRSERPTDHARSSRG